MLQTPVQDRLIAGVGATGIVAALGYMLLLGLRVTMPAAISQPLALLSVPVSPPPPPPVVKKRPVERPKTSPAKAAPAPPNLKNRATDIAPPPPVIPLRAPPPVVTAPKAGSGMASETGASDRPGPGQGAGGEGNGLGGGGNGDGGDTPPELVKGRLKFSDLPADLRGTGVGGSVAVRYAVDVDGRVNACRVTRSSGSAELDDVTCRLIEQRFRYKPSRDPDGTPVRSEIVETHSWYVDRSEDGEPGR